MMTGQRINRWWYRNFKLESFESLGDLKGKYELSDVHFKAMKKYYDGWKATHESTKAKRSSEGNVEGGLPAGLVANVDKITDEEEGDGESLPPSLGSMHVDREKTESTTTAATSAAPSTDALTFAVSTFAASTSAASTTAASTSVASTSATVATTTSKSTEPVQSSRAPSVVSDGLDDSLVDADGGETPKKKKMKSDRIRSNKSKRRHGHHRSHRSHRNDTSSSREAKREDGGDGSIVDDIDDAEKGQEKQRQDEQ